MKPLALSTAGLASLQAFADALNDGAHPKLLQLIANMKKSDLKKMWGDDLILQRMWREAIRVEYRPNECRGAALELRLESVDDYGAMLKRYYHRRDPEEAQKLMRAEQEDYRLLSASRCTHGGTI